jgi:hypothetical protein
VKHRVFWNLVHAVRFDPPVGRTENITLFTGLAGGVADGIINQMLAENNEASAAASREPDGGGEFLEHLTMDEDENIEEKDSFGLDKDRRLAERRARQAEEDMPDGLDPIFPFRVVSFDPDIIWQDHP